MPKHTATSNPVVPARMIVTSHATLYGWTATFDGYDGAEDAGGGDGPNAIGSGGTEIAAIRDLLAVAEEYIIGGALKAWDAYVAPVPLQVDGKINDAALDIRRAGDRLRDLRRRMELLRLLLDPQLAIQPTSP